MKERQTKEILSYDRKHLWHPYTSMSDPLRVFHAVRAEGVRIELGLVSNAAASDVASAARLYAAAYPQGLISDGKYEFSRHAFSLHSHGAFGPRRSNK